MNYIKTFGIAKQSSGRFMVLSEISPDRRERTMHVIEQLKGEKLVSYRPFFTDSRTGKTDGANYTVSLFPSEIERRQAEQSREHITVTYLTI